MFEADVDAAIAVFDVGDRRGMESGRFGLEVAEVGKGGKERILGVTPGMRSATTFWIMLTFFLRYSVNDFFLTDRKTDLHQREANLAVVLLQGCVK
jgi:hypothetical protein